MITRHKKRHNRGKLVVPLLALIVFGYFASQAYKGEHGIHSHMALQAKIVKLEKVLKQTVAKRKIMERRVSLLGGGNIEKDMLDEQIRRNLAMVHPDELVLLR